MILGTLMTVNNGTLNIFDRVYLDSGSYVPHLRDPRKELIPIAKNFRSLSKCGGDIICLRNMPAKELLKLSIAANDMTYSPFSSSYAPVVDGEYIAQQTYALLAAGKFSKIPMLISTSHDEGQTFISDKTVSKHVFDAIFETFDHEALVNVSQMYQGSGSQEKLAMIVADYTFNCPARYFAQTWLNSGLYVVKLHFKHSISLLGLFYNKLKVAHGSDLPV